MKSSLRTISVAVMSVTLGCTITACGAGEPELVFDTARHINAWVNLWNTYDLALVDELFLTDSTVSYFSSEREGLITGIDAVRAHHEGFGFVPGGRQAEMDLWVDDLHTARFRRTAIVTGIWYFGDSDGAPDQAQRGPFTFVYVQRDGEYRLAHLNFGTYLHAEVADEG